MELLLPKILPACQDNSLASTNRRFQFQKSTQFLIGSHNEALTVVAMRVRNLQISRKTNVEQPEEFEDNHDNDNYSDYVKDASVHARDSYQGECVVASIY